MSHPHLVALIQEPECIGCTKCIQVCPVDAIIGSTKKIHTVLSDICTGCESCIVACPVDCISLETLPNENTINWVKRAQEAQLNTQKRNDRIAAIEKQKIYEREIAIKHKNIKLEIQACINRKKLNMAKDDESKKT